MPRRARAWLPAGACLVGLIVSPARCSQAAAARAALPPYAARAAHPPAQAAATEEAGSSVACGSQVLASHTITPPAYSPDGITPSKSRYPIG